jgi:hypothetical protein
MTPTAFVIMPFAEEFKRGFGDVIAPAVEQAGLECVRADQDPQGHVHQQMLARIFDSPVVIADISGANPNVFYELGVAHRAGRKTVTVAREDFVDHVPFDIAPYRVLVYPRPPEPGGDEGSYRGRVQAAVDALAKEVAGVAAAGSEGIANPVQDFLASRSPLQSAESLFLSGFSSQDEEEMLRRARTEVVHVALTGAGFLQLLASHIESGERQAPLRVVLLLLDPEDRDAWASVYRLREGRTISADELDEYLAEDRAAQQRAERILERLRGSSSLTAECTHYSGVPLFWAYRIDGERLIIGHLAAHRLGARNLPVSVLVAEDPRTRALHTYYSSVVDALMHDQP